MFNLFPESEALSALLFELFPKDLLPVSFKLEGILMNKQVEQKHSGCPNIYFGAVTILGEVLGREERGTTDHIKHPLFTFGKLAEGEIVEIRLALFYPYLFRADVAID